MIINTHDYLLHGGGKIWIYDQGNHFMPPAENCVGYLGFEHPSSSFTNVFWSYESAPYDYSEFVETSVGSGEYRFVAKATDEYYGSRRGGICFQNTSSSKEVHVVFTQSNPQLYAKTTIQLLTNEYSDEVNGFEVDSFTSEEREVVVTLFDNSYIRIFGDFQIKQIWLE